MGNEHLSMASSQKVCKEMNENGDVTSQVVQWVRISLPMQGTRVRSLVWEDPTCRGATKPVYHYYSAAARVAHALQQEKVHAATKT